MSDWKNDIIHSDLRVDIVLSIIKNPNSQESRKELLRLLSSHAMRYGDLRLLEEYKCLSRELCIDIFEDGAAVASSPQNRTTDIHSEDTQNSDQQIKKVIEEMKNEKIIKRSYDYAFVMRIMNETQGLPHFDSPNSFLTYLKSLGFDDLPSEDSLKKKSSATFGKHPSWEFTDKKGKDTTEAKRRNNVASRFLSIYRKGK